MNSKLLSFFLTAILIFSLSSFSEAQQNRQNQIDERRWNIDVRSLPPVDNNSTMQYTQLPVGETFIEQPQTMRYESTPNGLLAISSSTRILPRTSSQSEVIITRHPLNPMILFASSNVYPVYGGRFSEGVYVSINGGASWTGKDSCTAAPVTSHVGDPGIIIDKDGRFIMTHLILDYTAGTLEGIGASYSTNNGSTWSVDDTLLGNDQDKNLAATDDSPASPFYGRSYCVWSRFTAALPPIAVSYTSNGGVNWSVAADINVPAAGHYSQGCDIRTAANGDVYVCWANPVAGGSFTEDNCGFAKSTNGGVSWTYTNTAFDMNGIRGTLPTVNNIRVNSFPRIDVDRTCGPYSGHIYIVVSQKNLAPAGTDPDIVIHKSTNGGTTWSAGIKVNQDALNNGKIQYFPCVRVDESGMVNVFYYDNRNTAAPVMQNYLSRSTDGGATFTDVQITDHNFTPSAIAGTASGYQGDYIGITSGGLGKIFCNWMDNSSGTYQSWIASVDVTKPNICEDFSCANFNPTSNFYEQFSGTNYWSRQTQSAFASGSGSARFNGWNASAGTIQSLISYQFPAAAANTYIVFDHAYQPWSGGVSNIDSLIIETSTNGGTTFTALQKLWGGLNSNAGPLNTVFTGGGQFTPTGGQWRSKFYLLPVNTNKVRLRANSGFGNDIWLDNVCVKVLAAPGSVSFGIAEEGYFVPPPTGPSLFAADTVRIYIHRADYPDIIVDSAKTILQTTGLATATYSNTLDGTYYIEAVHRNCITTWSKAGGFAYTRGSSGLIFNLITPAGQAYDNNQKSIYIPFDTWGMFSGDIDRNSFIDLNDVALVYNDASSFVTGYKPTDVTGNNVTDLNDLIITYNNNTAFVTEHAPPGAEPSPEPVIQLPDAKTLTFENDAQKEKYELTKKLMQERKAVVEEKPAPNWSTRPPDGYQNIYNTPKYNSDKSKGNNLNGSSVFGE